jgi:hypothetical protein
LLSLISSVLTSNKVYRSTSELPIHNWFKFEETEDVTWLLRADHKALKVNIPYLHKVAERLSEEYFSKHVLKGKYLQYLKLKKKWAILIAQSIEHNDRAFEMEADLVNAEIEKRFPQITKSNKNKIDNQEAFLSLESFMDLGVLDPKEMSVDEYYQRMEFSEKKAKKLEAQYKKAQENG